MGKLITKERHTTREWGDKFFMPKSLYYVYKRPRRDLESISVRQGGKGFSTGRWVLTTTEKERKRGIRFRVYMAFLWNHFMSDDVQLQSP